MYHNGKLPNQYRIFHRPRQGDPLSGFYSFGINLWPILKVVLPPCGGHRVIIKIIIMSDPEKGILPQRKDYQKVPEITLAIPDKISVTPNPFKSGFNLAISSPKDAKAQVIIYNALGMKVQQKAGLLISKGTNNIQMEGSNLSSGIYMVEIFVDNVKTVKKVVKL